jgi:methionyl-tRNA synthetase
MVYLTPDAPLQTGTQTYRSKHTGLFTAATDLDAQRLGLSKEEIDQKSFNGNNFYDRHNMELVDSVANVYNRCVIFNARALHSATSYFGDRKENARLFHLYFFDC